MDESTTALIEQLNDDLLHTIDAVNSALESNDENKELEAGAMVQPIVDRYKKVEAAVSPAERMQLERGLGRRITDLRRTASGLSQRQSGREAVKAVDAGTLPFVEQRAYRTAAPIASPSRLTEKPRYSVGGDVDCWCSKCDGIHEHRIVAIVDGLPKQVICRSCSTRHSFRQKPPEKHGAGAAGARKGGLPRAEDKELDKQREAKRQLQKQLAEAPDVRPFDPKGRYKSGEVLDHPIHGRGKIENVLKGSLLVRFVAGLKPLNLT